MYLVVAWVHISFFIRLDNRHRWKVSDLILKIIKDFKRCYLYVHYYYYILECFFFQSSKVRLVHRFKIVVLITDPLRYRFRVVLSLNEVL